MNGPWVALAAIAVAAAVWVGGNPRQGTRRLRSCCTPCCFTWNPSDTLLLQLMAAALEQGTSIPRALEVVGRACALEDACTHIARALLAGVPWDDAWEVRDGAPEALGLMADALRPAWTEGTGAVAQLEAAIDAADTRDRLAVEREASALSVRLLLPTGLCFLPAFLCIAVIPAILSFMRG